MSCEEDTIASSRGSVATSCSNPPVEATQLDTLIASAVQRALPTVQEQLQEQQKLHHQQLQQQLQQLQQQLQQQQQQQQEGEHNHRYVATWPNQ